MLKPKIFYVRQSDETVTYDVRSGAEFSPAILAMTEKDPAVAEAMKGKTCC